MAKGKDAANPGAKGGKKGKAMKYVKPAKKDGY
jgi:hypothetical protein